MIIGDSIQGYSIFLCDYRIINSHGFIKFMIIKENKERKNELKIAFNKT